MEDSSTSSSSSSATAASASASATTEATSVPAVAAAAAAVPAVVGKANRPWVEQHRPVLLSDVVAHEEILSTLRRLMSTNSLPHLLFYGQAGTGKTSSIQAVARELYGAKHVRGNVLELNASDERGIDVVRNVIKDFASTGQIFFSAAPKQTTTTTTTASAVEDNNSSENQNQNQNTSSGAAGAATTSSFPRPSYKLVILDEADQMTGEAQAALRRVIEQYTRNVRFCIICNHVNKIIPAVQSRCTRFRFSPVKQKQMLPRLEHICKAENAPCSPKGLEAAFKLSGGDMRRCVNMMQAAFLSLGGVHEETVYRAAGYPTPLEVQTIVGNMMSQPFAEAHKSVYTQMRAKGLSVVDLIKEMHPLIQKMSINNDCKCHCFKELADIEYYLSAGSSESIGLSAVLATMQIVKVAITSGTQHQQQQQQQQNQNQNQQVRQN